MSDLVLTKAERRLQNPRENVALAISQNADEVVSQMQVRGLADPYFIKTAFRLDDLLGGGISSGRGVIEITGEASSGKTQLMLDIALSCTKKVIYIATESRFPGKRIDQMMKLRECWKNSSLDDILVSEVSDLDHLLRTIDGSLPKVLKYHAVGVILIDSITWPFRVEDGSRDRTQQIRDVVRKLHHLSKEFNVAVVCVNHVADDIQTRTTKPCLGTSWSKGISGRLFLRIEDRPKGLRSLTVDWCEDYLNWKVGTKRNFYIRAEGLVEE